MLVDMLCMPCCREAGLRKVVGQYRWYGMTRKDELMDDPPCMVCGRRRVDSGNPSIEITCLEVDEDAKEGTEL